MSSLTVFFFRGLSTVGSDSARFSKLDFGPVYKHCARALEQHSIEFIPVLNMGKGLLNDISDRALHAIEKHPAWQNPNQMVHFLGHSAGGLVARLVLHKLGTKSLGKVGSCLTVATPHGGSQLARIFLEMPEKHTGSTRLLNSVGFNVSAKKDLFADLTPEGVAQALKPTLPPLPGIEHASIVCSAPREEWCRALRVAHRLNALKDFDLVSDGVVERDSQPYGNVIGEVQLDHFRQIGFFGETPQFAQIWNLAADFFKYSRF